MKTKLTLLLALLTFCFSVWGDELPTSQWNISSALPTDSWTAMGENTPSGVKELGNYTAYYRTQQVTLSTAGMININFLYSSGSQRLEILGVDALNSSSEVVASDYHFGYTGNAKSLNDYFLNGLTAGTYTLRYIINSGVSSSVGNITFRKFEADVVSSLPQLTTDVNNPKYYSIRSYDRGGYLTSNGAGQSMSHVAFAAGSSWYFTAINGNNSGSVIGGVIAHCSDDTQMKQNWQTAASGQTVYILPNGYNTYGFCISKTLPITSNSCCDASNAGTGVGNWYPRAADDWQGTTWIFEVTVPIGKTGYYYFKGMDTTRHPYLYSNFVTKGNVATYHHDLPATPSNGHIWKVTNEGTTFTLSNGEGLTLTTTDEQSSPTNTPHPTLTLKAASAGPDYFFTEAINLTNWGNDERLVTWTDGGSSSLDNRWTFELADISAGIYNVVVQGNNDGYVTYESHNSKNGGFFVANSIAVGDLTAKAIEGYTTSISISDRTITVSYNQALTYTLTDANGATYEGTYNGAVGVTEPTITGCSGYTLTNGSWSGTAYSATINFPFAVSSNNKENYTFIGQFNNKNGYSATEFLWHVNGTSIIIHSGDLPTTEETDQDKYLWSIFPSFSNSAFTFSIKNKSTGKYVNSTCTENRHNVGDVSLSELATPMTYNAASATSTCSPINAWYIPSTSKYLSANSVSNGSNAVLGVFGTVHDGISSGFPTYGDLISFYWRNKNIAADIANAGQYGYPALTNTYTTALNGVKTALNGGSYTGNKSNYNNLRSWYEGFLNADVVLPSAGFYRIKSVSTWTSAPDKYLIGLNTTYTGVTTRAAYDGDAGSSTSSIWYYTGQKLNNYGNGGYYLTKDNSNNIGNASSVVEGSAVAFAKANGPALGTLNIKIANDRWLYTQFKDVKVDEVTTKYYYTDSGSGTPSAVGYRFNVEKVTSLPITMNKVDDAYYATVNLPVAVEIPSGLSAYSATASGNLMSLTKVVEDGVLAANTPVVLYSKSDVDELTISGETGSSPAGDNELSGTISAIAVTAKQNYVLNCVDGEVGFYKFSGTVMPGFKAYLTSANAASVKAFAFSFEDVEDAIRAIESENSGLEIYDIAGRRVRRAQKGLYIVNGKKVMYK